MKLRLAGSSAKAEPGIKYHQFQPKNFYDICKPNEVLQVTNVGDTNRYLNEYFFDCYVNSFDNFKAEKLAFIQFKNIFPLIGTGRK